MLKTKAKTEADLSIADVTVDLGIDKEHTRHAVPDIVRLKVRLLREGSRHVLYSGSLQ